MHSMLLTYLGLGVMSAAFVAACGGQLPRHPHPPQSVEQRPSEVRHRVVLDVPSLLPIGDSARLEAYRERCHGDLCSGLPVRSFKPLGWTVDRTDVAHVSAEGLLTALQPGRVRVSVTIGDTLHHRTVTIIPSVTNLIWEPSAAHAVVGDTVRIRAIARDSAGDIVAIVPASAMLRVPRAATVGYMRWGGPEGTALVPMTHGIIVLRAILGTHSAETTIYVAPAQH